MKKSYSLILVSVLWSLIPKFSYGQVPTLGATDSFALFTAVGAFTVNGANTIFGDVGTNKGAFTISGSLTLSGTRHVQDTVSSIAATDVSTAYTDLTTLTCDSTLTTPLGNNRVLVPGVVYCITTAATLKGNLILDGQSTAGSIFNINIDGALSTDSSSTVTLINGASFCNVFWQVNGAVNLGVSSVFKGTVISNGAISLLDKAQLYGRALSVAGAISTSNNGVVGCDVSGNPLPIQLIKFTAKSIDEYVRLDWSTATEINNNYFSVQRSVDLITFEEVARVSGAGNSSVILNYSFIDYYPHKTFSYYRLKQTDFDGNFTYSDILKVKDRRIETFSIFPNPIGPLTTILLKEGTTSKNIEGEFRLYNIFGQEIIKTTVSEQVTKVKTNNLISGIYFYKIIIDNEIIQTGKMISN